MNGEDSKTKATLERFHRLNKLGLINLDWTDAAESGMVRVVYTATEVLQAAPVSVKH